ncbi:hypothetical protein [Streptomyces sp. ST2-7A]|uniref:hypothetical protein n=1 Tax=Streptomyces sp. ST2-7A TaxID=2907214 RepID=UPI001F33C8A2|nr:hypothetical protein [Streptomyces sp. ST2-7A]MCE7078905.1 hypothetical protein [Streptomyces sp. ST2-7A]
MAGTRRGTRSTEAGRSAWSGGIGGGARALPVLVLLMALSVACGGAGDDGAGDSAGGGSPDGTGAPTAGDGDGTEGTEGGADDEETGQAPALPGPALADGLWIAPGEDGRTLTVTEGGVTVTYSAGDPPLSCWGRPRSPDEGPGDAAGAVAVDFSCLGADGSGEGDPVPHDRTALLRPDGGELALEWEDGGTETFVADLS